MIEGTEGFLIITLLQRMSLLNYSFYTQFCVAQWHKLLEKESEYSQRRTFHLPLMGLLLGTETGLDNLVDVW